MAVKIGSETAGHFQIGTERVGIMKIGTEIAYRLPATGGPTPPWDFATSFSDGYAVDFIAPSPLSANRLFEVVPPRGTLNRAHPSGMFVDNSIYAIERVHRFTDDMILLHNGGQSGQPGQNDFHPCAVGRLHLVHHPVEHCGRRPGLSGLLEGMAGQRGRGGHWRRVCSLRCRRVRLRPPWRDYRTVRRVPQRTTRRPSYGSIAARPSMGSRRVRT